MNPHELLVTGQAAALLGVSTQTMADWRGDGFGPPYYQASPGGGAGHATRYRRADLDAWAEARKAGFTLRQATRATAKAAEALVDETIQSRFRTDPELAAAQRRQLRACNTTVASGA